MRAFSWLKALSQLRSIKTHCENFVKVRWQLYYYYLLIIYFLEETLTVNPSAA